MSKQKATQGNNGAAINPAIASAAASLEAARKQLRDAQVAFSAANEGYIATVESTKSPLELLDELERLCPLSEQEFQILRRYESKAMGVRLNAIGESFSKLRQVLERMQ